MKLRLLGFVSAVAFVAFCPTSYIKGLDGRGLRRLTTAGGWLLDASNRDA
jgi:hypothetical protein